MEFNSFGSYLKNLREKRKMTIRKLELFSGVSNAYISQIENGKRIPSPVILRKISSPLNISYEELMNIAGYSDSQIEDGEQPFDHESFSHIVTLNRILDRIYIITTNSQQKETTKEEITASLLALAQHIHDESSSIQLRTKE